MAIQGEELTCKNTISTTRGSQVFKFQVCVQIDRKGQSFPKAPILLYPTPTCNPPKSVKKMFFEEKMPVPGQVITEPDKDKKKKKALGKSKLDFVYALFCFRRRRGFKVYRRQLRNNLLKWVIIQNITTWDFIVACSIGKLDSLGYINLLWVTQEKKTKIVHVFWTMVFYRTLLPLGNLKFVSKVLLISNGIRRG